MGLLHVIGLKAHLPFYFSFSFCFCCICALWLLQCVTLYLKLIKALLFLIFARFLFYLLLYSLVSLLLFSFLTVVFTFFILLPWHYVWIGGDTIVDDEWEGDTPFGSGKEWGWKSGGEKVEWVSGLLRVEEKREMSEEKTT